MNSSLEQYWPLEDEVTRCVRKEAETASKAVLLAVHQQMHFTRRSTKPGSGVASDPSANFTEHDLLQALLEPDLPSGTLMLPIIGSAGTGKSHVIRWLDAQLAGMEDRDNRWVVRIPKQASLREVLRTILKDLDGEEYKKLRDEIDSTALSDLSAEDRLINAKNVLVANLLTALSRMGRESMERISLAKTRGESETKEDRILRKHCGENRLQALLRDPVTSVHVIGKSIDAIVRRVIFGLEEGEDPKTQFTTADLAFPEDIDLPSASRDAATYCHYLDREDSPNRADAITVLNLAIDPAIGAMVDLGGVSLSEIFDKIRRQFLSEGLELLLLVEDFATLAGVQGALLDVIKKEGIRDGRQELCTMRTALAVTEGYISYTTVLSRMGFEWVVEETLGNEEELIERTSNLVGAYLNAARIGESNLIEEFESGHSSESWPPVFEPSKPIDEETDRLLNSFDRCRSREYPLFPFNLPFVREACLSRDILATTDGTVQFNPRDIINYVLYPVLKDRRNQWLTNSFPTGDIANARANTTTAVQEFINSSTSDPVMRERYRNFLRLWGGNPKDGADLAHIKSGLYEAFDLKLIRTASGTAPGKRKVAPKKSGGKPVAKPNRQDASLERLIVELDQWRNGNELSQSTANELRNDVIGTLHSAVDWDALLLKSTSKPKGQHLVGRFFIPRARGNKGDPIIKICSEKDMDNDEIAVDVVKDLVALSRRRLVGDWDYEKAGEDISRIAAFINRFRQPYSDYLTSRDGNDYRVGDEANPIIIKSLLNGSKALGVPGSRSKEYKDRIAALFAEVPDVEFSTPDERWQNYVSKIQHDQVALRNCVLQFVGCRQGGAAGIQAVDAIEIRLGLEKVLTDPLVTEDDQTLFQGSTERDFRESVQRFTKRSIRSNTRDVLEELKNGVSALRCFFGEDVTKDELGSALLEMLTLSKKAAVYDGPVDYDYLRKQVRELNSMPVSELLNQLQQEYSEDRPEEIIEYLGGINWPNYNQLVRFVNDVDMVLTSISKLTESQLVSARAIELEQTQAQINDAVVDGQNAIQELQS